MADGYVESNIGIPMSKKQLSIPIPHVMPEDAEWLRKLLIGEFDELLSPGYPIKIRGIVLGLEAGNERIIIKATIDSEEVMCYLDGDDFHELRLYMDKRLERGNIRWSLDKYSKKN